MDWSGERYVRVYCRDTGDLMAIGWEGRCVLWELMRKCDAAGVFDESDPMVIADLLRIPRFVVDIGLTRLIERRIVRPLGERHLLLVNYTAAQYAAAHPARRKRKERSRASALAKLQVLTDQVSRNVTTNRGALDVSSRNATDPAQNVTPTGIDIYRGVRAANATRFFSDSLSFACPESECKTPIASMREAPASALSEIEETKENPVAAATVNALDADPDRGDGDREADRRARDRKRQARDVASRFVTYLNRVAGRRHRVTPRLETRVARLLREGHQPDDFKAAIDSRWREWQGSEFERYMTPSTILRLDKFAEYVEAASSRVPLNGTRRERTIEEMLPGVEVIE